MKKLIISDKIEQKDKDRPPMRTIQLNIPMRVLTYFLEKSDACFNYSDLSISTTIVLSTKDFINHADFYKGKNDTTIVCIYPYDNGDKKIREQTHRNYLKERQQLAEFIISFAKKIKDLKI
jgi:hypothetical protein